MIKIGILNYGMGNLTSVINVLNFYSIDFDIINYTDKSFNRSFDGYILPGVGSFSAAMKIINKTGMKQFIYSEVKQKRKPILGICLGMQLLLDTSNENGVYEGLKLIEGKVIKFKSSRMRIPHVGWNEVRFFCKENFKKYQSNGANLFDGISDNSDFFFDHSYFGKVDEKYVLCKTNYISQFASVINKEHIFGVQFHPEKSQRYGSQLIRNFANICHETNA